MNSLNLRCPQEPGYRVKRGQVRVYHHIATLHIKHLLWKDDFILRTESL